MSATDSILTLDNVSKRYFCFNAQMVDLARR